MSIKKRIISIVLCLLMTLSTVVSGTYAWQGMVSAINSFSDSKVETTEPSAELEVTKRIENSDGSEVTAEQEAVDFTFAITFSDGEEYKYEVNGVEHTLDNGTFTLKHGETAVFKGVPIGIVYKVIEIPNAENEYIISANNHMGNIKIENNKVYFTNSLKEEEENKGSLIVSKTVTGTENVADFDIMFDFVVELGEDPDTVYPYTLCDDTGDIGSSEIKSGDTINLKHGQWVVFEDLEIGLDYQVTEKSTVAGFIAQIIEKSGVILESGVRADFVNTKEPVEEPKFGSLIINKIVAITEGVSLVDEHGDPIADPMEKGFNFTIRVGSDTYNYILKHGESYKIDDIPVGTPYEVIEDNYYADGYITSGTNTTGTIVEGDNHANILNTLTDPPTEETHGKLRLEKHVVDGDTDKEFTFHVKIDDGGSQEIKLKSGGFHEWDNLPVGTPYQIYEEDYYTQGYITTSTGAMGAITVNNSLAIYTNTYQAPSQVVGELEISKTISGDIEAHKEFNFTVTFSDGENYPYELTDKEGNTSSHNLIAEGKFTLQGGEKAIFKEIPSGVTYEVIEEAVAGYLQGVTKQTGTIVKDTLTKAEYHNYKQPVSNEEGVLEIKKIVTGEGADFEKAFDFIVTIDGVPQEFSLANDETKIIFVPVGTIYEVSEKDYFGEGYILKSLANGHGTVTGGLIEIIAENEFTRPVTIADPPVTKIITGNPDMRDSFTFEMVAITKDAPMPAGAVDGRLTMFIEGMGTQDFGDMVYDTVGIYEYEIREVNEGIAGYTYDSTVYSMTITVTSLDEETIKHEIKFKKQGETAREMVFNNIYNEPDGPVTPTPTMPTNELSPTPTIPAVIMATPTPTDKPVSKPTAKPTVRPSQGGDIGSGGVPSRVSSAKTGDTNTIMLYVLLMAVAIITVFVGVRFKRKRDKRHKEQ